MLEFQFPVVLNWKMQLLFSENGVKLLKIEFNIKLTLIEWEVRKEEKARRESLSSAEPSVLLKNKTFWTGGRTLTPGGAF